MPEVDAGHHCLSVARNNIPFLMLRFRAAGRTMMIDFPDQIAVDGIYADGADSGKIGKMNPPRPDGRFGAE
jgi:hypothetical protein